MRREAADHIAELRRSLDCSDRPQPVFELALSWLDRRKPAPLERPVLVHGDYRTGNYLVDETGVTDDPRLGSSPISATRWRISAGSA